MINFSSIIKISNTEQFGIFRRIVHINATLFLEDNVIQLE
jgi:hypothetical protein